MDREKLEAKLANLYETIIDKAWECSDTFEAYQNAWQIIEREFEIPKFDWTKGEKPRLPK